MRAEIASRVEDVKKSLSVLRDRIGWDTISDRLTSLDVQAEAPGLWDDPQAAQSLLRSRQRLSRFVEDYRDLESSLEDFLALAELAEEEGDEEAEAEALEGLDILRTRAARQELEAMLSGEHDSGDAFIEITAGAGGTDSCDWAQMLYRMYKRWAERRGYDVEVIEETFDEVAGYKSAMLQISGEDVYGWAKTENGVHRLVRISPFDSQKRRHTSFAGVWATPVLDDAVEVEIAEKDLRIDTFRASGAGGQHVNKTDSAVRITHIPTGVTAVSSEKSQHQNRVQAMKVLRSRLYDIERQRQEEERRKLDEGKTTIGWGHQIRNYVLYPHRQVKDVRTGLTESDTDTVLDGDIDAFMEAELARRVAERSTAGD